MLAHAAAHAQKESPLSSRARRAIYFLAGESLDTHDAIRALIMPGRCRVRAAITAAGDMSMLVPATRKRSRPHGCRFSAASLQYSAMQYLLVNIIAISDALPADYHQALLVMRRLPSCFDNTGIAATRVLIICASQAVGICHRCCLAEICEKRGRDAHDAIDFGRSISAEVA